MESISNANFMFTSKTCKPKMTENLPKIYYTGVRVHTRKNKRNYAYREGVALFLGTLRNNNLL